MIWSIVTTSPLLGQLENMATGDPYKWIVAVTTGLAGTLFFFQLREIKQMLSEILKTVSNHDTRIAVLEHQVDHLDGKNE